MTGTGEPGDTEQFTAGEGETEPPERTAGQLPGLQGGFSGT
ncbi:hypothetical protein AB0D91_42025 [Streptomyces canus]